MLISDSFEAATASLRRDFLRQVIAGFGTLNLPHVLQLRAEAAASVKRQDTSLIVLWQDGGASHLETFDPKPHAPAEIRGELGSIATCHPGIRFGETLPRLARMADKFTLIRSVSQASSQHGAAAFTFTSGYDHRGIKEGSHPDFGAVIHRMRVGRQHVVPDYVALGEGTLGFKHYATAYLGKKYTHFPVEGDPGAAGFKVHSLQLPERTTATRFLQRKKILDEFDQFRRRLDQAGAIESMNSYQQQALNLVTGEAAAEAFDLKREDPRLRDRYGRFAAGQQALLARRLVESGVSIVVVHFVPRGTDPSCRFASWDDHPDDHHIFKNSRTRDPQMDQAVTALIEDLENRGLNQKVLLLVAGEFGRTPRIRTVHGRPGRDHWGQAASVLFYGGGLNMGQVLGATNKHGEHPVERPVKPQDVLATIYQHLGIDTNHKFRDELGRPYPILPCGEPIQELIS